MSCDHHSNHNHTHEHSHEHCHDGQDFTGLFITLEGVDGSGKSTQALRLAQMLESEGFEVLMLREPGGTHISEAIRCLLLDPANKDMEDECELLLYEAARAQLTREKIIPALLQGKIVICDRYYDSTYAYQAGARGLDTDFVRQANEMGSIGVIPDITLLFDIDPESAYQRAVAQQGPDRLEGEGKVFQQKVRQAYLDLAKIEDERIFCLDATGDIEEVSSRVDSIIKPYLMLD